MRIFIKVVAVVFLLPGLIFGVLYKLNQNRFFDIQKVELNLEQKDAGQSRFYAPLGVELQTKLNKQIGISLIEVSVANLNKELKKIEWIENFHIQRIWPRTLKVSIFPEVVKMMVVKKNGHFVPILESGKVLNEITSDVAPDVVLVHDERLLTNEDLRVRALNFLNELPREGLFSQQEISEFKVDAREGFVTKLLRDGTIVKMGEEHIALKAARVGKVIEYLHSKQFQARVIDANLSKKVLVRLRKDP